MLALGIDISTKNIGFCVRDENDNIYEFLSIQLDKYVPDKNLFKKVEVFEKVIDKILSKHQLNHIFIEKPLEFFKDGGSMAGTIILLNQFNILCQYILFKKDIQFHLVASQNALKCATGLGRKPGYESDKKIWLSKLFEQKHPEIKLKRYEKGNNIGEIHKDMYDAVDAWAVACCMKAIDKLD